MKSRDILYNHAEGSISLIQQILSFFLLVLIDKLTLPLNHRHHEKERMKDHSITDKDIDPQNVNCEGAYLLGDNPSLKL